MSRDVYISTIFDKGNVREVDASTGGHFLVPTADSNSQGQAAVGEIAGVCQFLVKSRCTDIGYCRHPARLDASRCRSYSIKYRQCGNNAAGAVV